MPFFFAVQLFGKSFGLSSKALACSSEKMMGAGVGIGVGVTYGIGVPVAVAYALGVGVTVGSPEYPRLGVLVA